MLGRNQPQLFPRDQRNSAKSGDILVIWGTGLGAITGSDAVVPTETDLGTPIQVFIGGIQASVLYKGRSASPGLDQINIAVPQGVSPGCTVSLVIQTGSFSSNITSIPIAPNGGQCSDGVNPLTVLSTLKGKSSYKTASFSLTDLTISVTANGQSSTTTATAGSAVFQQYTQAQITAQAGSFPSLGSCLVTVTPTGLPPNNPASLNAGAAIALTPPSGTSVSLPSVGGGTYTGSLSSIRYRRLSGIQRSGRPRCRTLYGEFHRPGDSAVSLDQSKCRDLDD